MHDETVTAIARAMCGRDIEWRDCERACLAAGKCVGKIPDFYLEDAKAALASIQPTIEAYRLLVEESLYHLRLDARAENYHKRALATLTKEGR